MRTFLACLVIALSSGAIAAPTGSAKPGALIHIPVHENGVVGTLVVPDTTRRYPGVLRLGGAEGGISLGDAETIAAEGYAVLALAYFGAEGLPGDLQDVPLEYFGKAIAWLKQSANVDAQHLAIVGISRGSTLALLLPKIYDDFDAVIAIAPSHVNWQSTYLNWDNYAVRSSFSYGGKPLPFVPYDFSNEAASAACNAKDSECVLMYVHSLGQLERVREAAIAVEKIRAPVLLLSGTDDSMWPSSKMADLVIQRLDNAKHPYEHRHIAYANAGHCGINRCYDAKPHTGDPAAVEGSRQQVFEFLRRYLIVKP